MCLNVYKKFMSYKMTVLCMFKYIFSMYNFNKKKHTTVDKWNVNFAQNIK